MSTDSAGGDAPFPDERAPLLGEPSIAGDDSILSEHRVPAHIARRLFVSHFLSTWNSRLFEFGAVLYLATIFPGTLLIMSVYALVRGLSAILFAPAVGQYIDRGNRLQVVRVSIVLQRLGVAASCVVFYALALHLPLGRGGDIGMLAALCFLACIEKLCSIMNLVSVEKDWVVVVAQRDPVALRVINAQMRRIDLLCKLFGPLFIALVDGYSTKVAIAVNFALNVGSVAVEYFAIARVYYEVPRLQEAKSRPSTNAAEAGPAADEPRGRLTSTLSRVRVIFRKFFADFGLYFRHRAFLPSIAGALLYLTVLSFGAQMVTYLFTAGYNSTQIGLARSLGVIFEVLATWVAPWIMGRVGPVRAGLWLSNWQVTSLATGIILFWVFGDRPLISASALVGGTVISRLGLRGFDLCTQVIVQEDVEAENRGAFSSVEAAFQSAFELLSYASTIAFSAPEQFRWPSLISVLAVSSASSMYTVFVYKRRGHLIHTEKICHVREDKRRQRREEGLERIVSRNTF